MYFLQVQVDKVTITQIKEAQKIIPGLKMKPVFTAHDALPAALAEMEPTLSGYQYFSPSDDLLPLPADGNPRSGAHYYKANETGWLLYLRVAGD